MKQWIKNEKKHINALNGISNMITPNKLGQKSFLHTEEHKEVAEILDFGWYILRIDHYLKSI